MKKIFIALFAILGFVLAVYFGLDSLGVALVGGVIAVVYFNVKNQKKEGL